MPKNVAQWTGLAVTGVIVFGCDKDVLYAMPLGIMAGALAAFLVALDEQRVKLPALRRIRVRRAI